MPAPEFDEFFQILSGRDPKSLDQLLTWLGPWLRGVIRVRLAARRMRDIMDLSDVFQSLIEDLVRRANRKIEKTEQVVDMERYLAAAVENKIRARLRKERRRTVSLSDWGEPEGSRPPAARIAEANDFVASIRRRLDDDSQQLFDLRMQGFTWPELSGMVGGKPDALRMRLRRSVAASICELNEEEPAGGR